MQCLPLEQCLKRVSRRLKIIPWNTYWGWAEAGPSNRSKFISLAQCCHYKVLVVQSIQMKRSITTVPSTNLLNQQFSLHAFLMKFIHLLNVGLFSLIFYNLNLLSQNLKSILSNFMKISFVKAISQKVKNCAAISYAGDMLIATLFFCR